MKIDLLNGPLIRLAFSQQPGNNYAVRVNKDILQMDMCYFEVEVERIDKEIDVFIGFCKESEFKPSVFLGSSISSVGLTNKGLVF